MEAIGGVVKGEFDRLLLVDGISSVCSLPLEDRRLGLRRGRDGVPEGLDAAARPRVPQLQRRRRGEAHAGATMPRYYFDVEQYQHYFEMGQPPYTPALSVVFALDAALESIMEEGVDGLWERHASIAQMTRDGIKALGLSLFPDESVASDTVTAVAVPENVDADKLLAIVREDYGVVLPRAREPRRAS